MKSDKFGTFFYQNLCQVVSLGHKNKLKFLSTFFISLKNFVYKFFYWKKILMKKFEKIFLKNDKKNKKIQKIFQKHFFTKNLNDLAKKNKRFFFFEQWFLTLQQHTNKRPVLKYILLCAWFWIWSLNFQIREKEKTLKKIFWTKNSLLHIIYSLSYRIYSQILWICE